MSLTEYFSTIKGNNLENNIYSHENRLLAKAFIEKYAFLSKDSFYVRFMMEINGIEVWGDEEIIVFYGFALSESELVYSIDNYLDANEYLLIGEYTDKRMNNVWRTIGYYYSGADKTPIIYAKFFLGLNEDNEIYYPLCTGFNELIKIVFANKFDEQFQIATANQI